MTFDDVVTWAVIFGLGYAAWVFKVKPEIERRKREEGQQSSSPTSSTTIKKPVSIDAVFRVQDTEIRSNEQTKR